MSLVRLPRGLPLAPILHLVQHRALLPQLVCLVQHIARPACDGGVRRLHVPTLGVAAAPPADLRSRAPKTKWVVMRPGKIFHLQRRGAAAEMQPSQHTHAMLEHRPATVTGSLQLPRQRLVLAGQLRSDSLS